MSAEEQIELLADYIRSYFQEEITEGGAGEVAIRILEKYRQLQATAIPDENILAEIRMPDSDGNICLTFVLDRRGNVRCWPDFGDPVRVDPMRLEAVAASLESLYCLCTYFDEKGEDTGKTFEEIVHER